MPKKASKPTHREEAGASAPAEPTTVSAVKADQLRTQNDLYRESIGHEIVQVADQLRAARDELERLKQISKAARSDAEDQSEEVRTLSAQLTQLALDMARVEDGSYEPRAIQQTLPFSAQTTTRVTTRADSAPLDELLKHGCPKGLLSSLASSQLGAERKLETIGDMLASMQADDYWYKKIKGMGEERKDKLIDALTSWGQANPEPDTDTRQQQCTSADCQDDPSRGIFAAGDKPGDLARCPVCGNSTYFQLVEQHERVDPLEYTAEEALEDQDTGPVEYTAEEALEDQDTGPVDDSGEDDDA